MQPYGRASTSTAWQAPSIYKWKRQLSAGINASLKNTKPVKSPCLKKPEEEERKKAQGGHAPAVFDDHEPEKRDGPGSRTQD